MAQASILPIRKGSHMKLRLCLLKRSTWYTSPAPTIGPFLILRLLSWCHARPISCNDCLECICITRGWTQGPSVQTQVVSGALYTILTWGGSGWPHDLSTQCEDWSNGRYRSSIFYVFPLYPSLPGAVWNLTVWIIRIKTTSHFIFKSQ